MSLDKFVQLKTNKASHKARGGSNGWDNTARNQFWFVTICGGDRIVFRPQIRSGHNKIWKKLKRFKLRLQTIFQLLAETLLLQ